MSQSINDILDEINRRREAGEGICSRCEGTGKIDGEFCMACLGQKIVLLPYEYHALWEFANRILD